MELPLIYFYFPIWNCLSIPNSSIQREGAVSRATAGARACPSALPRLGVLVARVASHRENERALGLENGYGLIARAMPYFEEIDPLADEADRGGSAHLTPLSQNEGGHVHFLERGSAMARLGFIGLGKMGGRAAKRLLDAGHTVTGYNRTRSKAEWLLDAGMQWGTSPRQVAEQSEIIFSMVTNTAAFEEICAGEDGVLAGLQAGQIFIDMSTISVAVSRATAERVAALGAHMLDVPISGNVTHVTQGTASLIVGGERAIFEQVQPVLRDISSKINYVGGNGQAILMKIAINLSLPVQFLAFSEGILLAEKMGISREAAIETWCNSAVASPATIHRAPFVLEKPEEVWFDVTMMQKDLLLALELGRSAEVPLPSVALAHELLTAARGMGLAAQDFAVIFEVLARMSGLSQ